MMLLVFKSFAQLNVKIDGSRW